MTASPVRRTAPAGSYPGGMDTHPDPGAGWLAAYEGLPLADAVALAETDGRPVRVLRPGGAFTAEYRSGRLNILVDDDGAVVALSTG